MKKQIKTALVILLSGAATVAVPAWAQESAQQGAASADQSGGGIEEIIVTAQRRSENAQKSSLAIQVLSAEAIQRSSPTDASNLSELVPGLQVAKTGSTVQLFVRGVGDITTNPLTSPAVAFNVDGVYIGKPSAIGSNFYDIARIEVLKGPQGTLYGRNASAGAINLITAMPKLGVTEGFAEGEIGNYALKRATGAVNIPLGETLALRASGQVIDRHGYMSDGTSDQVQQAGRLRLLWKPDTDLSVLLNFDMAHDGGKGQGSALLPLVDRKHPWISINEDAPNTVLTSYPYLPFPALTSRGPSHQDNKFINVSGQIDWNFGPATLTVIPAYHHTKEDFQNWTGFVYAQKADADQTSIEARLSNSSAKLKWVLGGFYFNETQDVAAHAETHPVFQSVFLNYHLTSKSYAAFGEATYSVTDALRVIGGLRYTNEKKGLTGSTADALPTTPDETYGPGGVSFNSTTWKAGAEFDARPQNMLFATVSTGFKAGGLNPSAAPNSFAPEKLTAYTLGSRNRFLDNHLQVNLELFYWDYKNQQISSVGITPAGNLSNLTRNAAGSKLKGASLDIVARPTSADTLRLFAEYNHTEYKNFRVQVPAFLFNPLGISTGCGISNATPGVVGLDCSGFALLRAPRLTASTGWEHEFALASGATITSSLNAQYSSGYWLSSNFTPIERASRYALLDASLTYLAADKRLSLTAYVKNITDHPVYSGGNQLPLQAPLFAANINAPRTFGARIRYSF